jgi:mono/diheme cytochrome c family protein
MKLISLLVPAALGLSLTAASSGGWAVITVEDLPTHLVAGQNTELRFKVRQHGADLMTDLTPAITLSRGKQTINVPATYKGAGVYAGNFAVPSAGQWGVHIDANWHAAETTLLPIAAVAAGEKFGAIPEHYRGKQLFVAKGCVTCHVHGDVANSGAVSVGPDLTGKKFAADYLKAWLADPSMRPPLDPNKRMPRLELKPQEIAALVAFINNNTGVAVR